MESQPTLTRQGFDNEENGLPALCVPQFLAPRPKIPPSSPDASSESFLVGLEDHLTYERPKKGPDRARSRRLTLGM